MILNNPSFYNPSYTTECMRYREKIFISLQIDYSNDHYFDEKKLNDDALIYDSVLNQIAFGDLLLSPFNEFK